MSGVAVIGATGSIGTQALKTIKILQAKERNITLVGISCYRNTDALREEIIAYHPKTAVVVKAAAAQALEEEFKGTGTKIKKGLQALEDLIKDERVDIVLNGTMGIAGLKPSLWALEAGKRLALANKESLVTGGPLVKRLLEEKEGEIIPVDSEHSAIFQLLRGKETAWVESLILTASGGPFLHTPKEELQQVTPRQALKHPTWSMGTKISIDSATLMNKALEVIEAHWLFNMEYDKIKVVVHPESIIHSLVEFKDRSLLAHLGNPDMCVPIQYAFTFPKYREGCFRPLNLADIGRLTFQEPRWDDFPALGLGYEAGKVGGTMPVVFNGAGEEVVAAFLRKQIFFTDMAGITARIMAEHKPQAIDCLETILDADLWARRKVQKEVGI